MNKKIPGLHTAHPHKQYYLNYLKNDLNLEVLTEAYTVYQGRIQNYSQMELLQEISGFRNNPVSLCNISLIYGLKYRP